MYEDPLIYGKNSLTRIVSVEIDDDRAIIFRSMEDGSVRREEVPNRFWILSPKKIDKTWIKLHGNQYYQYGKQYSSRDAFLKDRTSFKRFDTFSIFDQKESFLVKDGFTYFKGLSPKDVSILSFDIESTGVSLDSTSKVLIISNTYRNHKGEIIRKLFCYDEYPTQGELLQSWAKWVRDIDPSIICGHNIFSYDLPYMQHIADSEGVTIDLGRDGSPLRFNDYSSSFRIDGSRSQEYNKAYVWGRELIDTLFLSIKYDTATKKYESYALKSIIRQEGLEVEGREFYDASTIKDNYKIPSEWTKIKRYAEHDADDSLALYDLMVSPYFYMAQSIPKSFQLIIESATGSQINSMMIRSYLQEAHSIPKASQAVEYEGAISYGKPGIYSNVVKVDVASLYPSIMIEYEVCDEAKDPNKNFAKLVKTFTTKRLEYKKKAKESKYYDDLQASAKIFINSCYGFLGTSGIQFNSPHNAAFITRKGREILSKAIEWAESKGYTVANCDTDSVSYTANKFLSEEERSNNLKNLNSLFPETIRFEDDGYFLKFCVLKAKNYILYDGKKIKTKGSSLKDAKKEQALKDMSSEIIEAIIFDKNNFQEIYYKYVREAMNIKDIKRWSSKKSLSDKVYSSDRANETKIKDAVEGTDYREGDKVWLYFKSDDTLSLAEKFDGDYNKDRMLKKLFNASETFSTVLPEGLFKNYSLKKNKKELEEIILDGSL